MGHVKVLIIIIIAAFQLALLVSFISSPISLAILLIGFATLCSITTGFMFSS